MDYSPILSLSEMPEKYEEYCDLRKHFKFKYNQVPKFYVRVPGRVNLIGEHIDYCGFNVLPIGIEQDIVVAVGFNNSQRLNLTNLQSNIYSDFSTPIHSLIISGSIPEWYHYFICGVKGISEICLITINGLNVAVCGTIPASSGLSSSSALVCAAALATAYAHGIFLPKLEIASICAKAERYIGTEGGGMDQAIAFLAELGSAKLIKFNPLEGVNVPLPKEAHFVVANSCVQMNKAATSCFNIRVVECRIAAKIIAKAYKMDWKNIDKLKKIPDYLGISLNVISSKVREILHPEPYGRAEICKLLDINENELELLYLTKNTKQLQQFKLYDRACHVYDEALRVKQFIEICESHSSGALEILGKLMMESHRSCRDLYECSHPELDKLVEISMSAGALGSRLTGAGWGGCCVSLVRNENLDKFLNVVKENYFMKSSNKSHLLQSSLFTTCPGGGAVVYIL